MEKRGDRDSKIYIYTPQIQRESPGMGFLTTLDRYSLSPPLAL